MLETTDKNFQYDVIKSDTPVLVDFWAPWCSPCKAMNPILSELETEFKGRLKIVKVNIQEPEDNQAVANRFNIKAIPTFLIVVKGKVKDQIVGTATKVSLVGRIEAALNG